MIIRKAGIWLAPLLACVLLCSCGRGTENEEAGQTATESASENSTDTLFGDDTASDASEKISGTDISDEDVKQLSEPELERIGDFINQDSSYGFLLSFYNQAGKVNLQTVFGDGAGMADTVSEDEQKKYLDAVGKEKIEGKLVKITKDRVEQLLKQRTGLSYSDFTNQPDWTYLEDTDAFYFEQKDEERPYFEILDGYETDGKLIVHCREDSYKDVSAMYSMEGNERAEAPSQTSTETQLTEAQSTEKQSAETGTSASTEVETTTEAAAQREPGSESEDEQETGWHRDVFEVTLTRTAPFAPDTAQTAETADTADTAAAIEETAQTSALSDTEASAAAVSAEETPQAEAYDFRPEDYGNAYQFAANALYIQSGMQAQYSGGFTMNPLGQVVFAAYGVDSSSPDGSDATFEIIRDGQILQVLPGMTDSNIRDGLTFRRIVSVDVEDFDGDGYTDIAVICSYKKDAGGRSTEVRLYRGTKDGTFGLDEDTTKKINEDVESSGYSTVSAYLRGKSDGTKKTYSSWKEAYADQLSLLDADRWEGAELIYINEDRTPELLIYGKSQEQGVTLMTYDDGTVHDLHLLRRGVSWLESENVLLDSSSFMDRYYDVVYSVSSGGLTATSSGTYGSNYGADPVKNKKGTAEYDYDWDGADLSRDGYQEAMMFSFDYYREKTVAGKDLTSVGDLMQELAPEQTESTSEAAAE